jgi:hypothetical protein
MKTNGVPEKIYLQVCGDCMANDCENCMFEDLEDDVTWCKDKIFDKDVEYTRTDAFIEKACEKLKQLMYDSLMYQGRLERDKVIDNFIKNFKERIKGE